MKQQLSAKPARTPRPGGPDQQRETRLRAQGLTRVAGVDEAGRGPLAGPVVAAAVILPPGLDPAELAGLDDSKALSQAQRLRLFPRIQGIALDYGIGIVSAPVIDRINILQATYLAMWRALASLRQVDYVLIDGNRRLPHWDGPQEAIVKGDARVLSIAAASVLAKVTRDRIMEVLDTHYPGYGLARHMGYPTKSHREQILALGMSPQHRRSFCRKLLEAGS
ncbi:MAG: ribonuclease HII [Candidatus Sericytochromatia bacterium]